MVIDGYSHCGISKYRPVGEVVAVMRNVGVERAVLCQHLGEYDNTYLAQVVTDYPSTFAAICLVDPTSPGAVTELEKWHGTGRFRGVRLLAAWLHDYEPLWGRAVELGLTLVLYAPDGMAVAAPIVSRFLSEHPRARIVVTHLGNPQLRGGDVADIELLQLATRPGVFVQLSGLSQFCEYPYKALHNFIRAVTGEFGGPRVYWGSNFPVCGDETAYRRDLAQVTCGDWELTAEHIQWITSKTAEQLWFA